jgi:hypothetical protein
MFEGKLNQIADTKTADTGLKGLYRLGSAASMAAILLVLADIIISFGGRDVNPDTLTAIDWFKLFQDSRLFGLRMLGIINIISLSISIPLYLALYAAHRRICNTYAVLAMILYLIGAAIYISNNAAIPMYVLSSKYTVAATDAQRTLLAAAGEAIVAKGADFTPGSFIGFFFTEVAGIAFSYIMLRAGVFSKAAAYFGILGFVFLTVFTIWLTFIPVFFEIAMVIAMVGGLSSIFWNVLVARRLLQLGCSN